MPQELPGFYFDPEKNRYFPIKGPIPGTSRKSAPPPPQPVQVQSLSRGIRRSGLLHCRELYGNTINLNNKKCSFEEEYMKKLGAQPKVWKYQDFDGDCDGALTVVQTKVETPEGQYRTNALLTGGVDGSLSLFDIGDVGQHFNHGLRVTSNCIWPHNNEQNNEEDSTGMHKAIWKLNGASLHMPSISSVNVPRKEHSQVDDDVSAVQRALITTLGSDLSGGSLYLLNLADPVDLNLSIPSVWRLHELASLNCTVWTAHSDSKANRAVVGTNIGAKLVDLETGASSTLCGSKSDVLSVQLNQLGNAVLCGLRNGAVVTVDLRESPRQLPRHRIPYPTHGIRKPCGRNVQKTTRPWFLLKGNIQPSCTIYMPSAICCLLSLQMYDQYFLASSMDGTIKLYDHRLTKRGPLQSYEGHINSHTRIQLGIDPFERFVVSGGEDSKVRVWSMKSGEMLFEEKFTTSVPLTVSWQPTRGSSSSSEVWLGSTQGLLRMQFPWQ